MTLSVITPSYLPDLEICRDLHASLRKFGPPEVTHSVIVPKGDRAAFAGVGNVHGTNEFLPRGFVSIPGNVWINVSKPMPPVRGWIVQQIVKLEAAARSEADVVLLADSDMVFVRPFLESHFYHAGAVRFYRWSNAVHEQMPRHIVWHSVARRLLGLPSAVNAPLHDYICWPMTWDPTIVRAMLQRVRDVAGTSWQTAVAAELHFSEGILYGVYVDEMLGGTPFQTETMISAAYTEEVALDEASLRSFVSNIRDSDVAVVISAKSHTNISVRRSVLSSVLS